MVAADSQAGDEAASPFLLEASLPLLVLLVALRVDLADAPMRSRGLCRRRRRSVVLCRREFVRGLMGEEGRCYYG
jgi:hypothetical protein